MSELIDNRSQRVQMLKHVIRGLHEGEPMDAVRARVNTLVRECDASEIASMEQELIAEGIPVAEVMGMCDLHSQAVRDVLVERDAPRSGQAIPSTRFGGKTPPCRSRSRGSDRLSRLSERAPRTRSWTYAGAPPAWVDRGRVLGVVDADALLGRGQVPLPVVSEGARGLGAGEVLRVDAGFRPVPLIDALGKQGFRCWVQEVETGRFQAYFGLAPGEGSANDGIHDDGHRTALGPVP